MTPSEEEALQGQIAYYDQRAEWFDERFAQGMAQNEPFADNFRNTVAALPQEKLQGEGLEIACGTGLFTEHVVPWCAHLDAMDTSEKSLRLNAERIGSEKVTYCVADIFRWQPQKQYDFIFFSLFLCHVPSGKFASFWETLRAALKPDGWVVLVDKAESEKREDEFQLREHTDGREYPIVLTHDTTAATEVKIQRLGWEGTYRQAPGASFAIGSFTPKADGSAG